MLLKWLVRAFVVVMARASVSESAVSSAHSAPIANHAMLEVEATSKTSAEELDEMLSASMNRALSRAGVGGCRTVNKPCWVDAQCCFARCQPSIRRCRPVRWICWVCWFGWAVTEPWHPAELAEIVGKGNAGNAPKSDISLDTRLNWAAHIWIALQGNVHSVFQNFNSWSRLCSHGECSQTLLVAHWLWQMEKWDWLLCKGQVNRYWS